MSTELLAVVNRSMAEFMVRKTASNIAELDQDLAQRVLDTLAPAGKRIAQPVDKTLIREQKGDGPPLDKAACSECGGKVRSDNKLGICKSCRTKK